MMRDCQLKICKICFDFRVTPNPNFMMDVNLDVEFDNKLGLTQSNWNFICQANNIIYFSFRNNDQKVTSFIVKLK